MSNTENIAVEGTIPTAVQNTQPNGPEQLTMTMQEQRTRRLTRTANGLLLFWALVLQHVYADASEKKPMLTTGHANQVGVNQQRLELAADLVEESIDGGKIPNAVILVAKDGKSYCMKHSVIATYNAKYRCALTRYFEWLPTARL